MAAGLTDHVWELGELIACMPKRGSASMGFRETLSGGMTPRVRTALGRAAIPGLVWGIGTPLLRWHREPMLEALKDGAIMGAIMFSAAFCLHFFFPSFGRSPRRPRQNSN